MNVLVTVLNHKNKLAISKLLILNGDNIISWTNEMIRMVNYEIKSQDKGNTIELMKSTYGRLGDK